MAACTGPHECELYTGRLPEGEESDQNWEKCQKNPGHEHFMSIPYFEENYLEKLEDAEHQKILRSLIDCAVRVRVGYTSLGRPEDGGDRDIVALRGTSHTRVGTGWIWYVRDPVCDKPCPCFKCGGKEIRKHWRLSARTALHVVYDADEVRKTTLDLFYDDKARQRDKKTIRGLEMIWTRPEIDLMLMGFVTCDEDLARRMEEAVTKSRECNPKLTFALKDVGLFTQKFEPALCISHPHGQPKKVTVGELKYLGANRLRQYTTPTCPGSSGAQVFMTLQESPTSLVSASPWLASIHRGTYEETDPERFRSFDKPKENLLTRFFNKLRGRKRPVQQLNYGHRSV